MPEKLVYYRGRYWRWWGTTDRNGRLSLEDLRVDGYGVSANPDRARIVEGKEYDRQMAAIRYFQSL